MNILGFEMYKCSIHNSEIIAIDLDTSENGQFQYLCCNCLVEKVNNNNISTLEQTKDRIQQYKAQRQENKKKEIQIKLDQFTILLGQIIQFQINADDALQEIQKQIKTQIYTFQKEQQPILEDCQNQLNFYEDIKSLSEFLSTQENQMEFQQVSKFIDEILRQFELIFNNATYFQTVETFKDAKQKINTFNELNKIELMPLQFKNNQKTLSLSRLCPAHKKEIIMIDIDSKNKLIEDRLVCAECISDHPQYQYRTIEKVNQLWNHAIKEQDKFANDLQLKRQKKQEKLNEKIVIMRKNYNQQLNEISEKLITEFTLPITKTNQISRFKQTSIQYLSTAELLSNLNDLIQQDKEKLIQDPKIEYMISRYSLLSQDIESKLEKLKLHDQLDIQESINILQDQSNDNQIQGIAILSQQIQESTIVGQQQLIRKQELDEFISSSKQIYCQIELFNQTIDKFQGHLIKINSMKNKIKSIPDHQNFINIDTQLQSYIEKFEKDFKSLQKFCEIDKLEKNLENLQQDYKNLQLDGDLIMDTIEKDYKIKIQTQDKMIETLQGIVKDKEDEQKLLNQQMQELQNTNAKYQREQEIIHENQIQLLNQNFCEQDNLIKKYQKELENARILKLYLMLFLFIDIYIILIWLVIKLIQISVLQS